MGFHLRGTAFSRAAHVSRVCSSMVTPYRCWYHAMCSARQPPRSSHSSGTLKAHLFADAFGPRLPISCAFACGCLTSVLAPTGCPRPEQFLVCSASWSLQALQQKPWFLCPPRCLCGHPGLAHSAAGFCLTGVRAPEQFCVCVLSPRLHALQQYWCHCGPFRC